MITHEVFLVPWIFFHPLVTLKTLKDDLTKTIKVRNIGHLVVEELRHQGASSDGIVDLLIVRQ